MSDDLYEQLILERFLLPERLQRLDRVLENRTKSLTIVLDRICNYHNISAVLRSADAFGLTEVHFVGGTLEFSRGISLGTERWMQLSKHAGPDAAVEHLKQNGYQLVVLSPETISAESDDCDAGLSEAGKIASIPITSLPFDEKLALIFGNEADGIDPIFSAAADLRAYIPMFGFVESLNISVACAICLFCSTITGAEPARQTAPLPAEQREKLRTSWLRTGVRESELILKEFELRRQKQG